MKKNIVLVWGGYSSESVVSAKSMAGIYSFIDKEKYNVYKLELTKQSWTVDLDGEKVEVDKNDFSIINPKNDLKVKFDFAYITIHGTPGEDGRLQGYFEMMEIPHSTCSLETSALLFNKYYCNKFLKNFNISVADSIVLRKGQKYNTSEIVNSLGMPIFVKPSIGGSSFATTKVKVESKLNEAIAIALNEAPEAIIESFIAGTEITCGCYKTKGKIHALPITEVVSKKEFFDYEAKYEGAVEEITPARISEELTCEIQELTKYIYNLVGAKGLIRADFIISDNTPFLLEVNTTPGMTVTSFIPQQVAAAQLSITDVLTDIIEEELKNEAMSSKFDDIAPLYDHEVEQAIQELLVDPGFHHAVTYIMPDIDWKEFSAQMTSFKTKEDFQTKMIYPVVTWLGKMGSTGISVENWNHLSKTEQHVILSNHRDIVLDAGILNIKRVEQKIDTTEIAIGDNLLIHPWIDKLVRLNKSFIVKRGVSLREQLLSSKHLSEYIHYNIEQKGQSVWIAQREGRAKDSDDRTQDSLLKMLTLHSTDGTFLNSLRLLNIVPLSISYEFDPCDYLKAQEFQLKRDNPEFKKSQRDDLLNMEIGILGQKGKIVFRFGKCINDKLGTITETEKRVQVECAAKIIDKEIHTNYEIFKGNYVAHDMLNKETRFVGDKYTEEDKKTFVAYIEGQLAKMEMEEKDKDMDFLWERMLVMYSNTLKNHLNATGQNN